MNREYPKDVKLKDGSTITLKPFERKDKEALFTFFQRLPEGDRVEIYRSLRVDPKVARRERFRGQGVKRAGLFSKKREGGKAGY